MKEINLKIKTSDELELMTVDNTAVDIALKARFEALKTAIAMIKAETDKIQEIVLDKYEHKPVKKSDGKVFTAVVFDKYIVDEKAIVEKYGQDALDELKTRLVHTEYIKA